MPAAPTILVAVDLADDDAPLETARTYAEDLGATITVVHAVARPAARVLPQLAGRLPSRRAVAERLSEYVTRVTGRRPEAVHVREGDAADEIVGLAEELRPLVVVVGAPRRGGPLARARHAVRGWIGIRVAREAAGHVLIASRTATASGPVLVATDLSDPRRPAVVQALREASNRRTNIAVLHVVDVHTTTFDALEAARTRAKKYLADALEGFEHAQTSIVRSGPIELALADVFESIHPQLVVVGRRDRSRRTPLLRGGTLETIVRMAPTAVLVVPLGPPVYERAAAAS